MKRIVTYISSALLLMAGLCISCQKEQSSSEEKGASVNEVIVKATIGGADTKVSFTEEESTLKTAWENDDHIVGWDEEGNAIELKIASIDNGTAIFKTVEGSEAIPTSGKVYMIYAPGKTRDNISDSSLEYNLTDQGDGKLPALMTATGEVSNNVLTLTFANQLAILAVKNPTFPVTEATTITGLKLSGSNILTKATFSMDDEILQMESSEEGNITRACEFTTDAEGKTTETMVYFAVLPNSTTAEVTVSTTDPEGYQISFSDKSFEAGNCYMLSEREINKQTFAITPPDAITGGAITMSPSGNVAWGTEVTISVTPDEGYELTPGSITVTGASSGNSIPVTDNKFTMPQEAVTVNGSFQLKDYAITATGAETSGIYAVEGGTYTVQSGSPLADVTTAKMGDVITVSPSPETGYSGGTVTVKKTDTEETVTFDATNETFTMPAAEVTITVAFTHDTYSITGDVTPTSSGTVTFKKSGSDDGITQAFYDDEITVVDTPADGYELESIKWKEEGGTDADITSTKTFTMPAKAVTVTVTFKKKLSVFTVGSGTSVSFAQGNLYAKKDGDAWTWGFYDEQYKFHSASMPQISSSGGSRSAETDTEIDLFCWGYSANSTNPVNSEGISGNKNDGKYNFNDGEDWGNITGLPSAPYSEGWRTLSKVEWQYLLDTRTTNCIFGSTTNTSARYLKCKVKDVTVQGGSKKDVYGLMIFPDDFTWPSGAGDAPTSGFNNRNSAWNNVPGYSETQFKALEEAGVVFLPAAGTRNVASVSNVGSLGDYWSSSANNSTSAYDLIFHGTYVDPTHSGSARNIGRSVRLVSVVQ